MTTAYPADGAADTTGFSPLGAIEVSFIVASVICLGYAITFPVLVYFKSGIVLFSDVSIYYFLTAIGLFLTGRAIDFTRSELRQ